MTALNAEYMGAVHKKFSLQCVRNPCPLFIVEGIDSSVDTPARGAKAKACHSLFRLTKRRSVVYE
jgi:hypothetical protein